MTTIALALKPGEVSAVLPVANGFAVLRAEETAAAPGASARRSEGRDCAPLQDARRQSDRQAMRAPAQGRAVIVIESGAVVLSGRSGSPPLPPGDALKKPAINGLLPACCRRLKSP